MNKSGFDFIIKPNNNGSFNVVTLLFGKLIESYNVETPEEVSNIIKSLMNDIDNQDFPEDFYLECYSNYNKFVNFHV